MADFLSQVKSQANTPQPGFLASLKTGAQPPEIGVPHDQFHAEVSQAAQSRPLADIHMAIDQTPEITNKPEAKNIAQRIFESIIPAKTYDVQPVQRASASAPAAPTPAAAQAPASGRAFPLLASIRATAQDHSGAVPAVQLPNNNIGNLVYKGQPDAVESGRFAKFSSALEGAEALARDISQKVKTNPSLTLADFIATHAPPNENNTKRYLSFVAQRIGAQPTDLMKNVTSSKLPDLLIAIGEQEGAFGNGTERVQNVDKFRQALRQYAASSTGAGKQNVQ